MKRISRSLCDRRERRATYRDSVSKNLGRTIIRLSHIFQIDDGDVSKPGIQDLWPLCTN